MHYQTMQPSKMLTDTINILKVEAEKEYVEDSNFLIESLKNELISAIKGEKEDSWLSNLNTYVSKDFFLEFKMCYWVIPKINNKREIKCK